MHFLRTNHSEVSFIQVGWRSPWKWPQHWMFSVTNEIRFQFRIQSYYWHATLKYHFCPWQMKSLLTTRTREPFHCNQMFHILFFSLKFSIFFLHHMQNKNSGSFRAKSMEKNTKTFCLSMNLFCFTMLLHARAQSCWIKGILMNSTLAPFPLSRYRCF